MAAPVSGVVLSSDGKVRVEAEDRSTDPDASVVCGPVDRSARDREHLVVDLLLADRSLAGLLDDRVEVALPEGPLFVVSRRALLAMKRLASRPQDLADIEKLERPDA